MARPERASFATRDAAWSDGRWHVRVEGEQAIIYDEDTRRCWHARTSDLPAVILAGARPFPPRVPPSVTIGVAMATLGLLVGDVVALDPIHVAWPGAGSAAVVVASVVVHLGLHETAHVVVLRLFGRRVDSMGVKLNHIVFPAVYVRMSESLLLARTDQALVHVAGLTVNVSAVALTIGMTQIHPRFEVLTLGAQIVTLMACANAAPVLGSDGYRVLLALTGTPARRHLGDNPPWLVALKLVGVLVALLAGSRLVLAVGHVVAPQLVPAPSDLLPSDGELSPRAGGHLGVVLEEDAARQEVHRA